MNETVKIGMIGMGRIGKIHAENLLGFPGVELAAVADLFADDALRAWAAQRGIGLVTTDSAEITGRRDIDAVLICSSTDTHVPLITQAAASGKHIFCEKPVSMDIGSTREALEAVRRAGVKLQIGFNRRFDRSFARVRELVREGRVGEPHLIRITSRDPEPPSPEYVRKSGGIFMDMAIHDFDMARFLAGSEVEEVFACGTVLVDPMFADCGDYDTAVTTLRFASGALGVIDNSRRAVYGYDQRVEVFGSGGSAEAGNEFSDTVTVSGAQGVHGSLPLHFFLERYREAYVEEMKQFIAGIRGGGPVPVDGGDGLQAELIALAAKTSASLGRPVRLSELTEAANTTGG